MLMTIPIIENIKKKSFSFFSRGGVGVGGGGGVWGGGWETILLSSRREK